MRLTILFLLGILLVFTSSTLDGVWINLEVKKQIENTGSYGEFANYCRSADQIYLSSLYIKGNEISAFQPGADDFNMNTLNDKHFNMFVNGSYNDDIQSFHIIRKDVDTIDIIGVDKTNTFIRINKPDENYIEFDGENYLKTFYH